MAARSSSRTAYRKMAAAMLFAAASGGRVCRNILCRRPTGHGSSKSQMVLGASRILDGRRSSRARCRRSLAVGGIHDAPPSCGPR